MNQKQQSITFWITFLVILLVVVVGIFCKYKILTNDINSIKARNLAANLSSSTASNYKLRKANHMKGVAIKNCKDVPKIVGNHLVSGYEINDQVIKSDQVVFCTISGPKINSIQFSVIGIN